ncbi:MAG TPA: methyltransferase domain-containing protein [Arenimonas sp.]|nr:methyltransferase domain-containing protein [Arenimonas sp.]
MESSSLHDQRLGFVTGILLEAKARRVLDLGCGAGRLLARLMQEPIFEHVTGLDASASALAVARGELAAHVASGRLALLHGQVFEAHRHAGDADAVTLVEVIEHLEPRRLSEAERCVFGHYRPGLVVVTTPNVEYNPRLGLRDGQRRDPEHRFEWPRQRFRAWASGVARRNGYRAQVGGIGPSDADLGAPTQYALFRRDAV